MLNDYHVSDVIHLVNKIRPTLADRKPDLQGAVLADLFATYVAGHDQSLRKDIIELWMDMVCDLVEVYDEEIR